jgi:hypothetical protein
MLSDSAPARKIPDRIPSDLSLLPTQAELNCPRCYREAGFSATESHVWCPACGWIHIFTTEECEALVDALAGISDLNTQVYLQVLAAQDDPATSVPGEAAPAIPTVTEVAA